MTPATHAFRLLSRQREGDIEEKICHLVPTTRHIFWHMEALNSVCFMSFTLFPLVVMSFGPAIWYKVLGLVRRSMWEEPWEPQSTCSSGGPTAISWPFHPAGRKLLKECGFAWWGLCEVLVTKGDLWLTLYWPQGSGLSTSTSPHSLMVLILPLALFYITPRNRPCPLKQSFSAFCLSYQDSLHLPGLA